MQFQKKSLFHKACLCLPIIVAASFFSSSSFAQVNTVEFGKNRVQYKKFKWAYYQTQNFNTYYSQNGDPLAKYVAQVAEKELPDLERFAEYSLSRRANIILYNTFNEYEQSNIGLDIEYQGTGGNTKLVNNKMVIYYNGDHYDLRRQVRQGIAKTLLDNILFGDDLGEFAANQALLDLPKWLTDGYVAYAAENWSTELDDELKSAMLSGEYKNFYQFAFDKPMLAGHSFWNFIANNYKKENVTYFLYLARVYRNLNSASQRICKKKFKEVLREFMDKESEKYYADIRSRRNNPKGSMSVVEDISKYKDFFRFTPNPAPRSQSYAVVEFKHGLENVVLYDNFTERKVLLKYGVRNLENKPNPNYPMMAWDGRGTRLAVLYNEQGKNKLFVYDVNSRLKKDKQVLDQFDQIQDMKFMLDANTLLLSAVRNGQSDIYVYRIDREKAEQVTNDVYDDLDASFVAFPNKTGIIYSSNRPSSTAKTADTILPSDHRYNIFLVDNWNKSEFKQISQLTNVKYGNARYPAQYNAAHFTFVSDENGVGNRYAGFFSTSRAGIDTIYQVGEEMLRNPEPKELDSLLRAYKKQEPDSMFTFSVTNDSAYTFPITNYQSSLIETKSAGDNGQVSEVRREGDLKFLYKLKVDDAALKKRNVNARPTEYRKKTINEARMNSAQAMSTVGESDTTKKQNVFETGFDNEKRDSAAVAQRAAEAAEDPGVLAKAKRFDYKLQFSADQLTGSFFSNDVLATRYEPYTGSLPITLSGNGGLNGLLGVTVFDMLEDIRFTGLFRSPLINTAGAGVPIQLGQENAFLPGSGSLFNGGSEYLARFDYLKRKFDYSAIYYRKTDVGTNQFGEPIKLFTNLYQGIIKYPLDKVRSIRLSLGMRSDRFVAKGFDSLSLVTPDRKRLYALSRLEYVYDNSIQKATNIWNGLRYKAYIDINGQVNKPDLQEGRFTFNAGFDGRYYYPIFQNFIWAGRAAGDFSWGNQKLIYYLGGVDSWLIPKANQGNTPQDPDYAFQSLAVNLRGHKQNVSNGNNALVLNSEFRFPVFSTLLKRPINNAFLRNFQVVQFIDLGSAWNGAYNKLSRPSTVYPDDPQAPLAVKIRTGGVGPFIGGYGFGARSTLLGYFLRFDAGWPMGVFFKGKPIYYFALGVDF
jgi:hypothetical protein